MLSLDKLLFIKNFTTTVSVSQYNSPFQIRKLKWTEVKYILWGPWQFSLASKFMLWAIKLQLFSQNYVRCRNRSHLYFCSSKMMVEWKNHFLKSNFICQQITKKQIQNIRILFFKIEKTVIHIWILYLLHNSFIFISENCCIIGQIE